MIGTLDRRYHEVTIGGTGIAGMLSTCLSALRDEPSTDAALTSATSLTCEAAQLLFKTLEDDGRANGYPRRLGQINEACNGIRQDLSERLKHTLIATIDREDIFALVTELGSVVHLMYGLAMSATTYPDHHVTPHMMELATIVQQSVEEIRQLVPDINRPTKIRSRLAVMDRIQRKGRDVYRDGLRNLFRSSQSPQDVLVHQDLFQSLESIMERCDLVGTMVERISIKNA